MKKLFSAYYQGHDPFAIFGPVIPTVNPENLTSDGVLILWGGEDISPAIYGQKPTKARAPATPSDRDQVEISLFNMAVKLGMPIIGICRGAQLGCALSGGSLFQHIEGGHHENHAVTTMDGHEFKTSSCHHQALNLLNINSSEFDLLAWDKERNTKVYTDKTELSVTIPEVVHFKKTNLFAIQGHPEWMHPNAPFVKWCTKQMQERMLE